ncbi:hypothetical protein D3C84_1274850 [compost metagenome]
MAVGGQQIELAHLWMHCIAQYIDDGLQVDGQCRAQNHQQRQYRALAQCKANGQENKQ